jgi:hypothetical protein
VARRAFQQGSHDSTRRVDREMEDSLVGFGIAAVQQGSHVAGPILLHPGDKPLDRVWMIALDGRLQRVEADLAFTFLQRICVAALEQDVHRLDGT